MKKILSIIMAALLMATPVLAEREEEKLPTYILFEGVISEIMEHDNREFNSLLVENDLEEGLDKLIIHLSEDVLLVDNTSLEFINQDKFELGMEVSVYFEKNTPMLLSYPGQISPNVVIANTNEGYMAVKVDKFNNELISDDNNLKLNISEDTEIVDLNGDKLQVEDLYNKDLIVFYGAATKSIPAQTNPYKVIVLKSHAPEVMDTIIIGEERIQLENEIYVNENGFTMLPLRVIAENLGYEVSWIQDTFSVELVRGAQWTKITIGEDEYNFARMRVKLNQAPELVEATSYVPLEFVNEILLENTFIDGEGVLNILHFPE